MTSIKTVGSSGNKSTNYSTNTNSFKSNTAVETVDLSSYASNMSLSDAKDSFNNSSDIKALKQKYGSRLNVLQDTKLESDGCYTIRYSVPSSSTDHFKRFYTYKIGKDGTIKSAYQVTDTKTGVTTHRDFDGNISSNTPTIKSTKNSEPSLVGSSSYPKSKEEAASLIANNSILKARMEQYPGNWTHEALSQDADGQYYQVWNCTEANGTTHKYNIRLTNKNGKVVSENVIRQTIYASGGYEEVNTDSQYRIKVRADGTRTQWKFVNEKSINRKDGIASAAEMKTAKSISSKTKRTTTYISSFPSNSGEAANIFKKYDRINQLKNQYGFDEGKMKLVGNGTYLDSDGTYKVGYHISAADSGDGQERYYTFRLNKDGSISEASQIKTVEGEVWHKDFDSDKAVLVKPAPSSSNSASSAGSSSAGSSKAQSIIKNANSHVGGKYKMGGDSYTTGVDCSHFVYKVLNESGIKVDYMTSGEWNESYADNGFKAIGTDLSKAKPGDVITYSGHVAILGNDGNLIEAQSTKAGITNNRSAGSKKVVGIYRYTG